MTVCAAMAADPNQVLEPLGFIDLPGWAEDDHAQALAAFRRSCDEILSEGAGFSRPALFGGIKEDWLEACRASLSATEARAFFEASFRPYRVCDGERPEGLFTGYYEPEAEGSLTAGGDYAVPIYRKPLDLAAFPDEVKDAAGLAYGRWVDGMPKPYLTRREIEEGALAGQGLELVWLKDWADAFFMQIQGSGRVRLPDGQVIRLSYAAKSGLPYTGIGGVLADRAVLPRQALSMQAIRAWMKDNPQEARALMWENRSFVFFREIALADPALGALGAQHVQLTPRRSIAIDRAYWMLGTPVWLDTAAPSDGAGTLRPSRGLLIAQDTGSAIKGLARGDVYWGFGEKAALKAGPMKSPGQMAVLLPHAVVQRLGLAP